MAPPQRTRVLVVDDDPVILELLRINFEIEGFDVVSAADGQEGLERATADQPDVVLSDIMMPRLDGLQLLARLKADPATAGLPVVLLSAKAQTAEVERGLALGADDYVTKPFDPLELLDRVTAAIERGAARASGTARPGPNAPPGPAGTPRS
ncbi:MAG: response regulator transcription factor [Acidimicrobiales bacterium]